MMSEDQLEQETLGWLADLGYTRLYGPDIARKHHREVLLTQRLSDAIDRLNPNIPLRARQDALQQVLNLGIPALLSANRRFHQLLVTGVPVQYNKNGDTRGDLVRLIDWRDAAQNEWLAVNQYTIKGPHHTRRPDIVLFINGLPLVLLELKNPANQAADIWQAYNQIQTYKEQIPDIFQYNELLVISDGTEARCGSLSSSIERFMRWRTIDGVHLDPLGQCNELETLIRGLCAPTHLLNYLRYCVLFEDDGTLIKKTAGYHQYHAVLAALQQTVMASRPGGHHKGGVVWHTQGSGKSLIMVCFAAIVMQETAMENPTILVITDRNDLDGQLFGTFSLAQDLLREQPVQANTRQDLRTKLSNRPSGGIIFATIQKFMPGEDEDTFPMLSHRHNIVVIADEAHRTQYGFEATLKGKPGQEKYQAGFAQHLRDALPNATFVAFTGTPISLEDRDTRAVFGDYIHIYDMQQAKEDGATVPIYFESRLAKLALKEADLLHIDAEVDALTEDEEESQRAQLKSRWATLERVVGAEPRMRAVAADLVAHYEERCKAQTGKAMIVAMSRDICVHLYNEIIKRRPDWHDTDPEKGAIKVVITGAASDKALLRPHVYNTQVKKRIEKRFKDPDDPLRLVIVRDMWLTGFDVPCVHTLYVDKPMKGHNFMQAIARVNRVFKDKQGGLVVDYIGIADALQTALKEYTASNGRGCPTIDVHEAYLVLEEKLSILRGILHGFNYGGFMTGGHKTLAGAANHVLGLVDGKKRFADHALAMSKAFSLCCTLDEAKVVREEVAFMQGVKVILTKRSISQQKKTDETHEWAIRQIISSAVVSEAVVDIFDAVGLDKPNIGLLDEAFLAKVANLPERNLAVEMLARLLEEQIKTRFARNLAKVKRFSEMLRDIIRRYQNRAIETAQVIEELIEMAKKFREAVQHGEATGLHPDELLFYDALADNASAVQVLGDEILKKIAQELTNSLRQNITVDWSQRENIRAKLRLLVKRILRKYKYPPDQAEGAIDFVLRQAQALGEA